MKVNFPCPSLLKYPSLEGFCSVYRSVKNIFWQVGSWFSPWLYSHPYPKRQIYRQLKGYCIKNPSTLGPDFDHLVTKLRSLYPGDLYVQNITRINGTRAKAYAEDTFSKFTPFKKELNHLHESVEVFFLDVEFGKPIPLQIDMDKEFSPAHKQAIIIENLFLLSHAKKNRLPLTKKALNFLRLADNRALMFSVVVNQYSEIENSVTVLTQNQDNLPTFKEMKDYESFILQTKMSTLPVVKIRNTIWCKYLYQKMIENPKYNKPPLLLMMLHILEKNKSFLNHDPEKILEAMQKTFNDLNDEDLEYFCTSVFFERAYDRIKHNMINDSIKLISNLETITQ